MFVAPAPPEGEKLFVRRTNARVPPTRDSTAVLERLLRQPDGMVDVLRVAGGASLAELARQHPEILEEMRTSLLGVAQTRSAPRPRKGWAIADPYQGIEHAQLVVVNIHHDRQRQAAEQLVRRTFCGSARTTICSPTSSVPRASRIPITAVAANLADPDDPGRKKALARVRRAIRSASS